VHQCVQPLFNISGYNSLKFRNNFIYLDTGLK